MTGLDSTRTVRLAEAVYDDGPDSDDPAELLHEASKLQPTLVRRQLRGVARLLQDPRLRLSSGRAVRRNPSLPVVPLPAVSFPDASLARVLAERRSSRSFGTAALPLPALAGLLDAAYGVTVPARDGLPPLRSAPSAGALYPLELYVLARRVEALSPGIYHFDPVRRELEHHPESCEQAVSPDLFPDPAEAASAAAIVVVAAVFWRSRVKYGLRAYRFTLLEAGHATQNLLLAATAFEVGAFVLGGFFDSRVDRALGINGVDESSLIAVCLGVRP